MAMAMAMASCEPQFLQLNQPIEGMDLMEQETQTEDFISPIEDHVQIVKDKGEEEKAKEEEERAKEVEVYESDDDFCSYVLDTDTTRVRCLANESLKAYNRVKGSKYKLKRVLEAKSYLCQGFSYEFMFTGEECSTGHKLDNRPLKFLGWDNEKVSYNSADDKASDKLFRGVVYWELPGGRIKIQSCVMKPEDEESNIEKVEEEFERDDECFTEIVFGRNIKRVRSFATEFLRWYRRQRVGQVFFFLLRTGCYVLAR